MSAACEVLAPEKSYEPPFEDEAGTLASSLEAPEANIEEYSSPPLIIFDWDDTLLASSYLTEHKLTLSSLVFPDEVKQVLDVLARAVMAVLRVAVSLGRVYIVTNGETGWVQLSARHFMPGVEPLLKDVTVVSARSTYQSAFCNNPQEWKCQAFSSVLGEVFGHCRDGLKNVVSFGDSECERTALQRATRLLNPVLRKSVKFLERPSPDQLLKQIELMQGYLPYIVSYAGELDLILALQAQPKFGTQPEEEMQC